MDDNDIYDRIADRYGFMLPPMKAAALWAASFFEATPSTLVCVTPAPVPRTLVRGTEPAKPLAVLGTSMISSCCSFCYELNVPMVSILRDNDVPATRSRGGEAMPYPARGTAGNRKPQRRVRNRSKSFEFSNGSLPQTNAF